MSTIAKSYMNRSNKKSFVEYHGDNYSQPGSNLS